MSTPTVTDAPYRLLKANEAWARAVSEADPNFFPNSAKGQTPHVRNSFPVLSSFNFLMNIPDTLDRLLGFSCSRVRHYCCQARRHFCPAKYCQVCSPPLPLSLSQHHFNIMAKSQVHLDDENLLSVLEYAVNFLGVEHGALFPFHSALGLF